MQQPACGPEASGGLLHVWKGGGADDRIGFENRRTFTGTGGSNPSPSAMITIDQLAACVQRMRNEINGDDHPVRIELTRLVSDRLKELSVQNRFHYNDVCAYYNLQRKTPKAELVRKWSEPTWTKEIIPIMMVFNILSS